MKVFVASDHAGFGAKKALIKALSPDFEIEDLGPFALDPADDYPLYAKKVAQAVAADSGKNMGILVCKSGQGMEIAANKIDGIRASLVWNEKLAAETRTDNNSNVLSLPAGELSLEQMEKISRIWLTTPFSGEARHQRRIDEISQLEKGDD